MVLKESLHDNLFHIALLLLSFNFKPIAAWNLGSNYSNKKDNIWKELTCTFIDKFAFGLRSVWGRYVKLDSYILAFPILDANVCASNSRYRTIFKSKISGNRIQIWVGNYVSVESCLARKTAFWSEQLVVFCWLITNYLKQCST